MGAAVGGVKTTPWPRAFLHPRPLHPPPTTGRSDSPGRDGVGRTPSQWERTGVVGTHCNPSRGPGDPPGVRPLPCVSIPPEAPGVAPSSPPVPDRPETPHLSPMSSPVVEFPSPLTLRV